MINLRHSHLAKTFKKGEVGIYHLCRFVIVVTKLLPLCISESTAQSSVGKEHETVKGSSRFTCRCEMAKQKSQRRLDSIAYGYKVFRFSVRAVAS